MSCLIATYCGWFVTFCLAKSVGGCGHSFVVLLWSETEAMSLQFLVRMFFSLEVLVGLPPAWQKLELFGRMNERQSITQRRRKRTVGKYEYAACVVQYCTSTWIMHSCIRRREESMSVRRSRSIDSKTQPIQNTYATQSLRQAEYREKFPVLVLYLVHVQTQSFTSTL